MIAKFRYVSWPARRAKWQADMVNISSELIIDTWEWVVGTCDLVIRIANLKKWQFSAAVREM